MTRQEIIKTFRDKLKGKRIPPLDMQEAMEDAIEMLKNDKKRKTFLRSKIKEIKAKYGEETVEETVDE